MTRLVKNGQKSHALITHFYWSKVTWPHNPFLLVKPKYDIWLVPWVINRVSAKFFHQLFLNCLMMNNKATSTLPLWKTHRTRSTQTAQTDHQTTIHGLLFTLEQNVVMLAALLEEGASTSSVQLRTMNRVAADLEVLSYRHPTPSQVNYGEEAF